MIYVTIAIGAVCMTCVGAGLYIYPSIKEFNEMMKDKQP